MTIGSVLKVLAVAFAAVLAAEYSKAFKKAKLFNMVIDRFFPKSER